MSRDIAPFGVRMPSDLKAYLEQCATNNKRSLNAEIVARLQETSLQDKWLGKPNGHDDIIATAEEHARDAEEWREKYEREYGLDKFDAMKDEILEAIARMNK